MLPRAALALTLLAAVLAARCGGGDGEASRGSPSQVTAVATTTQVADLLANVGGDRVDVRRLLDPNVDPHEYEPRSSDAEAVADSALVVRSGGDLDEWLVELTQSAGGGAPVLTLLDRSRTIEGDDGADPHWWHDPRNGLRAVEAIRGALAGVDPEGSAAYDRNARRYAGRLRRLDGQVARCLGRIPARQRKLVTTHDALGYFAERYDVEAIGSVLDSRSTQAQPSAGDARELVEQMRREQVRVLFAESSVAPRLERAIAEEAGARVGRPLWADTLGPEGSSGDTYLKAMAANADAMARGFSAGRSGCSVPAAS